MLHSQTDLFVYGTLLFDEVVRALTGRTFPTVPASVTGYIRRAVERPDGREAYPAITPEPQGTVRGRVLRGVDAMSMRRIDAYEMDPPDYRLETVPVEYEDGDVGTAMTYTSLPTLLPRLKGQWDPATFKQNHLQDYVTRLIPELLRSLKTGSR